MAFLSDDELEELSVSFILVGMIFQTFSMTNSGLITSEGNARIATMGMVIGAGSNIVLDALFIIPLDLAIQGAAIATTIALLTSSLYFLNYRIRGKGYLRLQLNNFIIL